MHLIKNCKCQRTECCGTTCQDTEPADEYVKCTCYTDGGESQIIDTCGCKNIKCSCHTDSGESKTTITCGCKKPQQKCNCGKVSGKSKDSFPGYSNACKKSHYEHTRSHCQRSSCSSNNNPYTCRQFKKKKDNCGCGMTCQQTTINSPCCSFGFPPTCLYCKNGRESDRRFRCPRC